MTGPMVAAWVEDGMTYYTLLTREVDSKTGTSTPWGIAFGDYDREVVAQEREDMKEHTDGELNITDYKVIRTSAHQRDIDAAVAKLNAALKGSVA